MHLIEERFARTTFDCCEGMFRVTTVDEHSQFVFACFPNLSTISIFVFLRTKAAGRGASEKPLWGIWGRPGGSGSAC